MDLHKLLERQLRKRAVGTLVLNRLNRFREVFFEDDQAYLVDEPFSGKVAVEELFARHVIGERLSLPKFETVLYSADLTKQLLPEILRDQGVLGGDALRAVAEEQILEEIVDLFLHNTTSFHFQEGRVPERLLGCGSLVAEYSVSIERLTEEFARRVERRREIAQLIPSDQEIFVVTEAGMVHKETRDANYAQRSVFNLLDGMRDLGSVVDDSCLFAFHVYSLIDNALRAGFLKKTIHPELRGFSTSRLSAEEAEQYLPLLKNAVKYGADELAARERLAVLYEKLGRVEDAVIQFNFVGDTLYRMDRSSKAIKAYQKALDLKPGEPLLIDKMASVYVKLAQDALNNDDKALATRLFVNVLRMRPDDLETFTKVLSLHLAENNIKAVSETLDLVRAYASKVEDADLAIEACRAVVARLPRDIGLRKKLVNIYLDSGRAEDAAREMRILAGLYVKAGNTQMAQSLLDKVSRLNGEEPPARGETAAPAVSARTGARTPPRTRRGRARGVITPAGSVLLVLILVYQLTALLAWRDIERRFAHAESLSHSDGSGSRESRAELERVSRACERFLELYPISAFGRGVRRIHARLEGPPGAEEGDPQGAPGAATGRGGQAQAPRPGTGAAAGGAGSPRPGGRPEQEPRDGSAAPAVAVTSPAEEQARSLVARAAELEGAGRWWEAAAVYREAIHRFPSTAAVASVRIPVRIESMPAGARVHRIEAGSTAELLGTTPLVRHLESGGFEKLEISESGYAPRRVEVTERAFESRESPLLVVLHREPTRSVELGERPTAPPLLDERNEPLLYCPLERGKIAAVNVTNGDVKSWSQPGSTAEHVNRRPIVTHAGVYTVWNDARVMRLRSDSGKLAPDGVFSLPGLPARSDPVSILGGRGFVLGTIQSTLLGFAAGDASGPAWSLETPGESTLILRLPEGPAADASLVVGTKDGMLMKLAVVEAKALVEWKCRVAGSPIDLLVALDAERIAASSEGRRSLSIVSVSSGEELRKVGLPDLTPNVVVETATLRAYSVLPDATLSWLELDAGRPGHGRLALGEFLTAGGYDLVAVAEGELALLHDQRRAFLLLRLEPTAGAPSVSWSGSLGEPIFSLSRSRDGARVVAVGKSGRVRIWESR